MPILKIKFFGDEVARFFVKKGRIKPLHCDIRFREFLINYSFKSITNQPTRIGINHSSKDLTVKLSSFLSSRCKTEFFRATDFEMSNKN
ncbi:hypothetical protein BpHYR1_007102 [Brachionus plicatilis]|uniref:Uncharacterized protein n=1 Tax=Brachionus plicatilis TaxID=10195 RepID=A0A3M7SEH5_BRAPC|nr:hypothetical protein BpHYR1_007102 [Brachionus plicatilis]